MLSDAVFKQLTKSSPLQQRLVEAAWTNLTTESKLAIIDAASGPSKLRATPYFLIDLAQADSAEIIRYWATVSAYFERPPSNELAKRVFADRVIEPAQVGRTARLDSDPSELVRAAGVSTGIVSLTTSLIEQPQLTRLVQIRKASSPSTDSFADFVEAAIKAQVADQEVCECIDEYFAREDVFSELQELHPDGYGEYSKTNGWEHLWSIAAKASLPIAFRIATRGAVSGKFWKLKLEVIEALSTDLLTHCVYRDEDVFEELRETVRKSPDKFDPKVVKQVKSFDEMRVDFGVRSDEDREKARLQSMPSHADAIFETVRSVDDGIKQLAENLQQPHATLDQNHKLLEGLRTVGWLIVVLLAIVIWRQH
jgi:hypothetical protein